MLPRSHDGTPRTLQRNNGSVSGKIRLCGNLKLYVSYFSSFISSKSVNPSSSSSFSSSSSSSQSSSSSSSSKSRSLKSIPLKSKPPTCDR
ncbi:MAG: hypothetical protein EAZ80_09640 [Runella slithyformis]|nr:MAG: hypothetical protein EAZ80_09640 [Runella slithyformis]